MGHSHTVQLSTNLDYGGSFDREKVDPDLNYGNVDRYRSAYNRVAALTSVELKPMRVLWFKSFLASVSASYQHDLLSRTRLVQLQRETPAATTLTEGESNAVLLRHAECAFSGTCTPYFQHSSHRNRLEYG